MYLSTSAVSRLSQSKGVRAGAKALLLSLDIRRSTSGAGFCQPPKAPHSAAAARATLHRGPGNQPVPQMTAAVRSPP